MANKVGMDVVAESVKVIPSDVSATVDMNLGYAINQGEIR
jgi:hypothetical protein